MHSTPALFTASAATMCEQCCTACTEAALNSTLHKARHNMCYSINTLMSYYYVLCIIYVVYLNVSSHNSAALQMAASGYTEQ
jgi:hypothetical protein